MKNFQKRILSNLNRDKWEMKLILLAICFFVMVICFSRTYSRYVVDTVEKTGSDCVINDITKGKEAILLNAGCVKQEIYGTYDGLSSIKLRFIEVNSKMEMGQVVIRLYQDEAMIQEWNLAVQDIQMDDWTVLQLTEQLIGISEHRFVVEISSENEIGVLGSKIDTYEVGRCYQNDDELYGDIAFVVGGSDYTFLSTAYYIIGFFMIAGIIGVFAYLLFFKNIKLEVLFLCGSLFFGTLYSIVLPPFAVPDESAHYVNAFHLSEKMLGNRIDNTITQDTYGNDGIFNRTINVDTYRSVYNALHDDSQGYVEYYNKQYDYINSTLNHFIQALGITVARICNWGYIYTIYFGRVFNLLFYSLVMFFAIRLMPIKKMFMFVCAFLPIVIELSASFSYDAWIISFAFLFIAYCMNCIYKKEKITVVDTIIMLFLLVLCSYQKYIYYPMGLLIILIPKNKFIQLKKHFILAGCCLIAFLALVFNFVEQRTQTSSVVQEDSIIDAAVGADRYTLSDVLENPIEAVEVIINTLRDNSGGYLEQILGGSLGSLNISIDVIYLYILWLILFVSGISVNGEVKLQHWKYWGVLGIICSVILLAILAMFIAWTNISSEVVTGVQGRYFIPILPLICILLSKLPLTLNRNIDKYIVSILFTVHGFILWDIFEICMLNV